MNIIFFGSSDFAVPALEALVPADFSISCVVTQPDKEKGRGLHFEATAVKTKAQEAGLKIYQPDNINADESIEFLKKLNPDLFIVVSYGQILSKQVLNIPKNFALNIHASLLPRYRGAAPINWAVINGEQSTGISIIKMTEEMDAGPIISQETIGIGPQDTAITLSDKLSKLGAKLLISTLESMKNNDYQLLPQDESKATPAQKLKKEDGKINWQRPAAEINNLIKGCLNWPGAFTRYSGKLLKIYKASVLQLSGSPVRQSPGEIVEISKEGIAVATGGDNLVIEELQIEGKRKMTAKEFIAGHRIKSGERLGNPAVRD